MALGNDNNENLDLYFLSIRGLKSGEQAHIKVTKTTGEKGKYEELKPVNSVTGDLVKIETKTKQVGDNPPYEELRLWLKDADAGQLYILSCGLNNIGRSLINLLASIEGTIGILDIRVYNNKNTGMQSIYVEHNGEKLNWKYDYKTEKEYNGKLLPALSSMVTSTEKREKDASGKVVKKQVNDYLDLNEFMLKVFREEVGYKVDKNKAIKEKPSGELETDPSTAPKKETKKETVPVDDDLPF